MCWGSSKVSEKTREQADRICKWGSLIQQKMILSLGARAQNQRVGRVGPSGGPEHSDQTSFLVSVAPGAVVCGLITPNAASFCVFPCLCFFV